MCKYYKKSEFPKEIPNDIVNFLIITANDEFLATIYGDYRIHMYMIESSERNVDRDLWADFTKIITKFSLGKGTIFIQLDTL